MVIRSFGILVWLDKIAFLALYLFRIYPPTLYLPYLTYLPTLPHRTPSLKQIKAKQSKLINPNKGRREGGIDNLLEDEEEEEEEEEFTIKGSY